MKKAKSPGSGELRREYKRKDVTRGLIRGRFAARLAEGSYVVRLDPEIAAAFPTSEAVNEALGSVLRAARVARLPTRSSGRGRGQAPGSRGR